MSAAAASLARWRRGRALCLLAFLVLALMPALAGAQEESSENGARDALIERVTADLAERRMEHYARDEQDLDEALKARPSDTVLRLLLGEVLLAEARATASAGVEQAAAARARAAFETVLDQDPTAMRAALGLAQVLELGGHVDGAVAALDRGLDARRASPALVTEKGRILYAHAVHLHEAAGRGYPLSPEVARAFRRAQGALLGATTAVPEDLDSCLRLAWASQTLGDIEVAVQGYRQALHAAPESPLPLRGLRVLFANDADGYAAELERMAEAGPPLSRALLLQAKDRIARKEWAEAERTLDAFLAAYPEDADGLYGLGELREAQGQADEALDYFRRAVVADGDHLAAADRVDRSIRQGGLARAKANLDAALDVEAAYAWLVERTPHNPFVRNNVAFLLREAWLAHEADPAWRPVLDAAIAYYDDAVRVIGPWTPEKQRELPWATRHAYAQIVNDTGVIRHLYEPCRDLARAEHDYLEAMRYAEWGYIDAWTYLRRIYEEQARWPELYRLACRAAEALADAAGRPLEGPRAAARALAERLEAEGRTR